jgi:trimethylamine--corrinoid protein Co-methyltransferase
VSQLARSTLKILSDQEISQLNETSFQILREFGVLIDDQGLRNDLADHGCEVDGKRVKIKADLLEKVIANAKVHNHVTLTSRDGIKVEITPDTIVSHTTGGIPDILDLETGQKRRPVVDDVIATMRLMNHLEHLDTPCSLLYPSDVPAPITQVKQTELMFRYSKKPIYGPGISNPGEAKYVVELFRAFAGGSESLAKTPIGVVGVSPESPLKIPQAICDTMKNIISAGIPTSILSAPIGGMSGPLTLAGGLAQVNAETLAFATVAYVINPETPLFYGSRLFYANMKTGCTILGLPETGMVGAAAAQLAASNGFLSDLYGLCCTSCTFDSQSGYEKAVNCLLPVMAGADWISGFGAMASLMVASYEQLVIDNEIFGLIKKAAKGITVNEDTLGLDVLASAIKGSMILADPHTIKHLRGGEIFIPDLGFDSVWNDWGKKGQKDLQKVAQERVYELLKKDEVVPLPEDLDQEVNKILDAAAAELVN